ncbi:VOC family protein [Paraurantiacibacter namhicola]|nr:VOC family protein [Paraurantiacibacter namhicola]
MAIAGLNHLTLAVSDSDRSISFYRDILGFHQRAVSDESAYFEAGSLWLCLSLDEKMTDTRDATYSHVAFDVPEDYFAAMSETLAACTNAWQDNSSEGASHYFLDPDGHKLEIHVGSLASRLQHHRQNPAKGVRVFDD